MSFERGMELCRNHQNIIPASVLDCQVRKRSYSAGITGCGVPTVLSRLIKENPASTKVTRGVVPERIGNDGWLAIIKKELTYKVTFFSIDD